MADEEHPQHLSPVGDATDDGDAPDDGSPRRRNLAELRKEYAQNALLERDAPVTPWPLFDRWFRQAALAGVEEPNAMLLSTATAAGAPSCRAVLLKAVDGRGFVFFGNRESRKGLELEENPLACLTFFWPQVERQVRVEGTVEQVHDGIADAYFASRPLQSQLSAWASPQSRTVGSRAELDEAMADTRVRFGDGPIARPPQWGGWRLVPEALEFWQGRPSRLHDRLLYEKRGGEWKRRRLGS